MSFPSLSLSIFLTSFLTIALFCAGLWQRQARLALELQRLGKEKQLLQTLFPDMVQAESVEAALRIFLAQVCQTTGWQVGEAWVSEDGGQTLDCLVWYTNPQDQHHLETFQNATLKTHFKAEQGLPGRVWTRAQSEWLQDVSHLQANTFARHTLAHQVGLKAALGIPIQNQNQVVAVLVFFMNAARAEDQGLVHLLQSIALQLGNVLAQKQTEAALRDAELRYRSIFENAVEGIFQTSKAGNYLAVNPALAKMYGFDSCQELIESLGDISQQLYVRPERRQEFERLMEAEGSVYQFESEVYRKDGQIIWISETARSVKDEEGNVIYYEGMVDNITKRKAAEELLRKSEAKNRALLNIIPDAILRLNHQGYCLDFIPEVEGSLGLNSLQSETIVGQHIVNFLPQEAVVCLQKHLKNPLEKGKVSVFEYQDLDAKGNKDYEVRVVASDLEEVLVIIRNITGRKRMERLKNEFVSMVSHELRTPLTSVKGSLGLIMGGAVGEVPPQIKSLIEIALKNSERLILIINDILDIEKIESGKMDFKMQNIDLWDLVEQAIISNQGYAEKFNISYRLDPFLSANGTNSSDLKIYGDSDRLNQVLTNLLSNAAKFSPPEAIVQIAIEVPKSGWVRVAVQDQGPGIPEDFRSKIFQKFAQADSSDTRQKGGTGLGLSISKAIVERHQGKIGFCTPESGGTIFYFDLPLVAVPSHTPLSNDHQPIQQGMRVLICEDDPDIANLLSLMLKSRGMASDIVYSAAEAKAQLALKSYAAMTLDLALPGQDGISLIRELRQAEQTATLPIVVVSAKAQQGKEALSCSSVKVLDWLDKPIDQNRLMLSLGRALQERSSLRPRILHIENDLDILQIMATILRETADIIQAQSLEVARAKLDQDTFDLVILDLDLPDGSGLELLPMLYTAQGAPIPVVIFSAQDMPLDSIHHIAATQVAATLVKSRTSNQNLLDTITSLIAMPIPSA